MNMNFMVKNASDYWIKMKLKIFATQFKAKKVACGMSRLHLRLWKHLDFSKRTTYHKIITIFFNHFFYILDHMNVFNTNINMVPKMMEGLKTLTVIIFFKKCASCVAFGSFNVYYFLKVDYQIVCFASRFYFGA